MYLIADLFVRDLLQKLGAILSVAAMMLAVSNSDRLGEVFESMFNRWGKPLGLKCFDFPFPFKSVNYHITYQRWFINDLNHQRLRELIKQEVSL
ncbi:hypothetical protein A6E01_03910 [Vibrio breoganii]|uniref:Uncharacterized protein n=1 Tax=Vibrio breoganii TaxID=553239 RepID=A0AAN0XTJ9_9VIBR|nr:hypothetical protein [Vibrio breoganii]ANO32395.1 hypothetical protein A6E01_03910 [Vibrio breoganii]